VTLGHSAKPLTVMFGRLFRLATLDVDQDYLEAISTFRSGIGPTMVFPDRNLVHAIPRFSSLRPIASQQMPARPWCSSTRVADTDFTHRDTHFSFFFASLKRLRCSLRLGANFLFFVSHDFFPALIISCFFVRGINGFDFITTAKETLSYSKLSYSFRSRTGLRSPRLLRGDLVRLCPFCYM
jgi:hypothetical protein